MKNKKMKLYEPIAAFRTVFHLRQDAAKGRTMELLDLIFRDYAPKDAWSLSRLTHGEICWKRSRKGISPYESSDNMIPLDDIRMDARRIRERREMFSQM